MDGGQWLLWAAVLGSGIYHGLSPGMGWPLAVSAGLWEKRTGALVRAMLLLGVGHLLAMALVLLPAALLARLAPRLDEVRIVAGAVVVAFGLYRLVQPRHPRALARIHPSRLVFWSFLIATAHGAALLILPVYLGMAQPHGHGHHGVAPMVAASPIVTASAVAIVHTLAMMASGGTLAWLIYRYLGLRFLRASWFNLDTLWALSLILAGGVGVGSALV